LYNVNLYDIINMRINRFKIKELMAQKKIDNFSELARMLGISKNQLSSILSDRYNPIKSNVIELAEFFGVDVGDLLQENKKSK
jgi:transcriptional regulator with XRE-family HTH domain